jgi:diaminopimelate decarboxylase
MCIGYLLFKKMPVNIPLHLNELENIASEYDTPYYLYDIDLIKTRAENYMNAFKNYFPNFKQYFAVKALPNPSILKILKECGMNFDCSSPEEIQIVELVDKYSYNNRNIMYTNKYSYNKSDIMYTSNYTSKSDLEWVLNNADNSIINLDSIDCFQNLLDASNHINVDLPDTICFRYNPIMIDGEFDTTDITHIQELKKKSEKNNKSKKKNINNENIKSNNFSGENTKFGMSFKYILEAYKLAKDKGIKNFGIHVMPHSNCMDIDYWSDLIDHMFQVKFEILTKLNIDITFMDIGGGIGIPYKPYQKDIILEDLVELIRDRFDYNMNYYDFSDFFEPQLITECGRYITGPYGWLISRCQSIKKTDTHIFYGLDATMANLMRPGMYEAYHHITIPRLKHQKKTSTANVVGTLCENNDWFAKNRDLPSGIKKGDLFIIHDCGAHAYSMGFNYNSKLHCPEILIEKNSIYEIRKKEDINYHLQNTLMHQKYQYSENVENVLNFIICFCSFYILYYFFKIWIKDKDDN